MSEDLREPYIGRDGFIYYDLDLNPEPWRIGPLSVGRRKGGKGVYPMVGRDAQLHAYKEAVREQLEEYRTVMLPGPYHSKFFFWRLRDVYTTPLQRQHRKHDADLTNMVKATEDACQGILFDNDRDCVSHENFIFAQGAETKRPRVIVAVSPVTSFPEPREVLDAQLIENLSI